MTSNFYSPGKYINEKHPSNPSYILFLYLAKSGNDTNDKQFSNKKLISISLLFHFDISGKDIKDEHPSNIFNIYFKLLFFHLDISGKDVNDEHR